MSPKTKNKSFPPVKVTEEFLEETKQCADKLDLYLSDYIRKAVELYNRQINIPPVDSTHKNNTVSKHHDEIVEKDHQDMIKRVQQVQSFPKDGGKK